MRKIAPYLGLAGILVYAYLLDAGVALLEAAGARSFILQPVLWGGFLANLFLAVGIIWLMRLVRSGRLLGTVAAVVFAVVGFGIAFYPALASFTPLLSFSEGPGPVTFDSRLAVTGAFTAVIGLWRLLAPGSLDSAPEVGQPANGQ